MTAVAMFVLAGGKARTGRALDNPVPATFLDHLEHERGNSVRTRNARLAAVHSLFRYAALRHPEHADVIQRVLAFAIPPKRFERALVSFLNRREVDALLAAPDRSTWTGRRDHALLLVAVQRATGDTDPGRARLPKHHVDREHHRCLLHQRHRYRPATPWHHCADGELHV